MSAVRGWCPSAYRPMASGDGLLVRVKPRFGRIAADALSALADLSDRFGNGVIDLTSRGSLQVRGVSEAGYPALLDALIAAGLVDADAEREGRRNVVVTPFWAPGDLSERLAAAVIGALDRLPELPGKMGIAVDTGSARRLTDVSADFRFEMNGTSSLILRADGAAKGVCVTEETAVDRLIEMAEWFVESGGLQAGRMARHIARIPMPDHWNVPAAQSSATEVVPGTVETGQLLGVPFGQMETAQLRSLLSRAAVSDVRVLPWRMLLLEDAVPVEVEGFLSGPDPLLYVAACPGALACGQGEVATRNVARALVGQVRSLHVSGCAKGCARQAASDVTLVGRNGRFDLVRNGRVGETPQHSGLTEAEVVELLTG